MRPADPFLFRCSARSAASVFRIKGRLLGVRLVPIVPAFLQNMAVHFAIYKYRPGIRPPRSPEIHLGSVFIMKQAAIHEQGVVLANELLAEQELQQGNLQEVLHLQLQDPKSFYVVYHPDRENDDKVTAFRDWLISVMGQEK